MDKLDVPESADAHAEALLWWAQHGNHLIPIRGIDAYRSGVFQTWPQALDAIVRSQAETIKTLEKELSRVLNSCSVPILL